jgi:endo-1,4-beta-xylanase
MMNRRNFLGAAAGVMSMGAGPSLLAGTDDARSAKKYINVDRPLKAYGDACGRLIGAQADKWELQIPELAEFIGSNFSILTPGNQLKWSVVHPAPDKFNFADADWTMNFAKQHGMALHGHNLCWNGYNPGWLKKVLTKSNAEQYLTQHIKTVAGRYAGRINSWDVVNEPVGVGMRRPDGLYPGPWLELLGTEYIDIAFHVTAETDPKALRVLNVHHVEEDIASDDQARKVTLNLIQQLVKRGVPIQAVGLESHILASDPVVGKGRDQFVKQLRDLGLQILITELDVDDTKVQGDIPTRDQAVANTYHDYLMAIIPVADPKQIIIWTVTDQRNWIDGAATTNRSRYGRGDAASHRPGLLDQDLGKKVVFNAFADALKKTCSS